MRFILLLVITLFVLAIFLNGCQKESPLFCLKNSDCIVSGCNGEICANREMPSVCWFKPEYACLKYSSCECINFQCQWKETREYKECLENISDKQKPY